MWCCHALVPCLRIDPNVTISAKYAVYSRLGKEFVNVTFHSTDQVVIYFEQHTIFQLAILERSCMQLDLSVKSAN